MAETIELDIHIGENILFSYPLPCVTYTRTPYISWTLPLERIEEEKTIVNEYVYNEEFDIWVNKDSNKPNLTVPTNRILVHCDYNFNYDENVGGWYNSATENLTGLYGGYTYTFNGENWVKTGSQETVPLDQIVVVSSEGIVLNYEYIYDYGWIAKYVPSNGDSGVVTYTDIEVSYERLEQERFNCRIIAIDGSAMAINGSMTSKNTYFQWPTSNPMTDNFTGLCSIEVTISSNLTGDYEYTSGVKYFVFDTNAEIISRRDNFLVSWNNSTDVEQTWEELKYNLVVATEPTFTTNSVIFDEMVNPSNRITTYQTVNTLIQSNFYFYKVRAFDGFDYSKFTPVNGFMMTDNRGPSITIHGVEVTGNDDRDVIIDFSISDPDNDVMNVKVFYFGGTGDGASENGAVAFMATPLVAVNSGRMQAIWRSSVNEKMTAGNYHIYMIVSDVYGISADATSTTFYLDNLDIGVNPSSPNNLSYNFRFNGRSGNKIEHVADDELFRSIGNITDTYLRYKDIIPKYKGYNSTWSTYICDTLNPSNGIKENPNIEVYVGSLDFNDLIFYPQIKEYNYQTVVYPNEDGTLIEGVYLNTKIDNCFNYKLNIRNKRDNNKIIKTIVLEKYDYEKHIVYLRDSILEFYPYSKYDYRFDINGTSIYQITEGKYKTFFRLPLGMSGKDGTYLDEENDPKFISCLDYVDSDGNYPMIETNPQKSLKDVSNYRKGYIRFVRDIYAYGSDLCDKCGGKGWVKEELVEDTSISGPYRFKRVPCSICGGHRFYYHEKEVDNTNPERFDLFWVSDYRPINGYIAPIDFVNGLSAAKFVGKTRNAPKYVSHIIGQAVPKSAITEYGKYQKVATTMKNTVYGIDGWFDGFSFSGYYGFKKTNTLPDLKFRYVGKMLKDPNEQKYFNRYLGNIFSNLKNYIPGVYQEEDIFNFMREIPTWKYEAGMICFKGNTTTYRQASQPLEIIYLQDTWSEYNTIHWNGEISSTTTYHVQYREARSANEIEDEWHDVIPENGFYDELRNVWLVNPNQRHCFWHTINQIPFNTEKNYYIRVEQYNILTGTFTGSVISNTTFSFGEYETNPANIYYVEYKSMSKELYIYYRIDDPNNDNYDVIEVSYSPDGTVFYPIAPSHLSGYTSNLTSYKKVGTSGERQPNEHLLVWDTFPYNLTPGDDYRIRIRVIKSKFVLGCSLPILTWRKDPNTFLDENKHKVEEIEGTWQYYAYDEENSEVVRLDTPFFVDGTYQEIKNKIEEIKRKNSPLPKNCYGYYSFLNSIEVEEVESDSAIITVLDAGIRDEIEINGKTYRYLDWMSVKDSDGYTRNDRLYMLSNEFDELTDKLYTIKDSIDADIRYTRKLLIDQGYYCNGYKFNKSENGKFEFKVLLYFADYLDEEGKYIKPYSEHFGDVIYQYETVEQDDLIEEPIVTTTEIYEYDRVAEIYSRIQIDQYNNFSSQNGRPMRDFIFVNGERISSLAGGEDYLKNNMAIINEKNPPETSYVSEGVTRYKNVKENFSIPRDYLPGERSGDITHWTDEEGSETFEGPYYWRVSSYNIIRAPYNEKPFVASQTFSYESGNEIYLHLFIKADEDITSMNIKNIWYFDDSDSSYSLDNIHEVYFGTDVDDADVESGDTYDFNWLPMTKDRTRPIVIIDKNHRYNMWYSRSDNYGNKIIVYSKGRCEDIFGDYDTAVPSNNKPISEEFTDINNVFSPYVFYRNGMYYMYYTANSVNGNTIQVGTSSDGYTWFKSSINGVGNNVYNPFARYNNGVIELYYCKFVDGLSKVYRSVSNDGISFTSETLFFESENNISSIFILEHNGNDVTFYSESYEESDSQSETNYHYRINNNSNGVFPIIDNASNFYCYKDLFDYVFYYDFDNKIYTGRMKNYTKKTMSSNEYNKYISGLMNNIPVNKNGVNRSLVIKRNAYRDNFIYYCNSQFRNNYNIKGFIVELEGTAPYKEYRIECPFLSADNVENSNGELDPVIYRYMKITKES